MTKYLIVPGVLLGIFIYDLWRYDLRYACAFLCLTASAAGGIGVVIYLIYLVQRWSNG